MCCIQVSCLRVQRVKRLASPRSQLVKASPWSSSAGSGWQPLAWCVVVEISGLFLLSQRWFFRWWYPLLWTSWNSRASSKGIQRLQLRCRWTRPVNSELFLAQDYIQLLNVRLGCSVLCWPSRLQCAVPSLSRRLRSNQQPLSLTFKRKSSRCRIRQSCYTTTKDCRLCSAQASRGFVLAVNSYLSELTSFTNPQ